MILDDLHALSNVNSCKSTGHRGGSLDVAGTEVLPEELVHIIALNQYTNRALPAQYKNLIIIDLPLKNLLSYLL